jgi:hypothetical protein
VKLSKAVNIFTPKPRHPGASSCSGTVLMLASTDTYPLPPREEYGCIIPSKRYNVLWSDVSASIMDSAPSSPM